MMREMFHGLPQLIVDDLYSSRWKNYKGKIPILHLFI